MKSNKLLSGPVNSTLKEMTIPMMFGLVLLMSFNIVDTFYVSMLGTESLAAFSFTFPVTFTLVSLAIGMGVGVSAVVARTLGQKDHDLARQHASVAIGVSAILIYTLAMVGLLFIEQIFGAMGANSDNLVYITSYMTPWLLGCLIIIMPMIGNSVMRASGDTKTPAKVMGIGALINAILDPIFIFGFGPVEAMGIKGAAIASILASVVSCSIVYYRLTVSFKMIGWDFKMNQIIDSTRKLMAIGLPAAASNMMTPISSSIITAIVAGYGTEAVAAFGVGTRIESFAVIVVLALSMSLPPFISQNFGAGQIDRVKQAYTASIKFVMLWQGALYVLLFIGASPIANLFADDPQVVEIIMLYLMIIPVVHGLVGITILTNSSLNAMHKPMSSISLNIIRLFVLAIPCAYIGGYFGDIQGLIIGVAIAGGLTGLVAFAIIRRQFCLMQVHDSSDESALSDAVVSKS